MDPSLSRECWLTRSAAGRGGSRSNRRLALLAMCCAAAVAGCGTPSTQAEIQEPVVTINDLRLTAAELQQELALAAGSSREGLGTAGEETPEWLSRLIERELLVQAAQRAGLDREAAFMRTIERFWKEALIKQLLSRKAREIGSQVHVYEPEIEAWYQRLSQEVYARILSCADEACANRLAQAASLEDGVAAIGPALADDTGWRWYTTETLDPALETALAGAEPGSRSQPIRHGDRWLVVAVAERRARALEPLSVVRDDIRRAIRQQKEAEAMERWIGELKGSARIVIDREALATLQ